jgi:cell division protein ZipA
MGGTLEQSPLDEFNPELPSGGARIVARGVDERVEGDRLGGDRLGRELYGQDGGDPDPSVGAGSAQTLSADTVDRIMVEPGARDSRSGTPARGVSGTKKSWSAKSRAGRAGRKGAASEVAAAANPGTAPAAPEEVLVINVDARTPVGFKGADLKHLLEACGLVHGQMSIFHRHEEDDLLSPLQFSVANGVEPGYFDPDSIEQLETPSVAFFMSLPGPRDYMRAFDYMLETAQCFARNLEGELRDENRSVMTAQTIEHCRQRIKEFERKQLSRTRSK